jgi:hypothetical protein
MARDSLTYSPSKETPMPEHVHTFRPQLNYPKSPAGYECSDCGTLYEPYSPARPIPPAPQCRQVCVRVTTAGSRP